MLNGVHIVDFGNHRNTRLTFGPMTALVGKNGSGKTTVMRAVEEIGSAAASAKEPAEKASVSHRRGSPHEILAASWASPVLGGDIDRGLRLNGGRQLFERKRVSGESNVWIPDAVVEAGGEQIDLSARDIDFEEKSELRPGEVRAWNGSIRWICRYFKTGGAVLRGPSYSEENPPRLGDDGSNLAWNLAYLMTAEPDRFDRVADSLREVVPVVKRLRARPVPITRIEKKVISFNDQKQAFDQQSTVMGQELIFDMKSGDGLPASAVSEGTLVVLAVMALVCGYDDADLIMLDDVELGLHPQAQRDLIRQLRKVQEKNPKLQIIISTHSPYVIDEFKSEDVWLFSTDSGGCAVSSRLSEHPDATRALDVLTTGEFWSAEGESWVLGEEPTARVAEEPVK